MRFVQQTRMFPHTQSMKTPCICIFSPSVLTLTQITLQIPAMLLLETSHCVSSYSIRKHPCIHEYTACFQGNSLWHKTNSKHQVFVHVHDGDEVSGLTASLHPRNLCWLSLCHSPRGLWFSSASLRPHLCLFHAPSSQRGNVGFKARPGWHLQHQAFGLTVK